MSFVSALRDPFVDGTLSYSGSDHLCLFGSPSAVKLDMTQNPFAVTQSDGIMVGQTQLFLLRIYFSYLTAWFRITIQASYSFLWHGRPSVYQLLDLVLFLSYINTCMYRNHPKNHFVPHRALRPLSLSLYLAFKAYLWPLPCFVLHLEPICGSGHIHWPPSSCLSRV